MSEISVLEPECSCRATLQVKPPMPYFLPQNLESMLPVEPSFFFTFKKNNLFLLGFFVPTGKRASARLNLWTKMPRTPPAFQ